ncbi:YheC/YheD family endospore coat-associated protein [Paenibacillus sp. y28]|uniref:YheC/YheD family endospore coat-associated protein n=1 Tax=Paenibacillus sp. y28 TaxID=3129110 RepID=UPI0030199FAB
MAITKLTIQVMPAGGLLDEKTVVLGERFMKKWKLPGNSSMVLHFGSAKQQIKIISAAKLEGMRVNQALAARLGVHHGQTLCLQIKPSSRTIIIGPLIGVMVSRVHANSPDKPFSDNTAFCNELTDGCRHLGGAVFFFTASDIAASNLLTISGWSYHGRWRKSSFPIPDVIYNRLTSRKLDNKPSVQQFLREVKSRYNTSVFNEKYLNKTEVFDALRQANGLSRLMPESHLFRNAGMLSSMCSKYATVFLKPITGSLGKGIIKISKLPGGSYVCHFTNVNGTVRQSYPSLSKVYALISGKMRQRKYQIQQGLRLIAVHGRPVDFRALVHRGEQGAWAVTSVVGRIAGANHFVSNIARGGAVTSVKQAIQGSNLPSGQKKSVYLHLRKAALDIARGIETQIKGHFGELGIDLAVDTNGRVWLLEVNSKPSKNDNTPLTESKIRPSVKQLLLYSRFLAGF